MTKKTSECNLELNTYIKLYVARQRKEDEEPRDIVWANWTNLRFYFELVSTFPELA